MEHTKKFVPSTKCENFNNNKSPQTYLIWFDNLQTFSISHFCKLRLVNFIYFDSIQWNFFFVGMNVVMGWKTTAKTPTTWGQSNIVAWPTFLSKGFYTQPKCGGNIFLPSNSYSNQWDLVHGTRDLGGSHHECWRMFHTCFTSQNILYGPN
jgi:hypothetical protein